MDQLPAVPTLIIMLAIKAWRFLIFFGLGVGIPVAGAAILWWHDIAPLWVILPGLALAMWGIIDELAKLDSLDAIAWDEVRDLPVIRWIIVRWLRDSMPQSQSRRDH